MRRRTDSKINVAFESHQFRLRLAEIVGRRRDNEEAEIRLLQDIERLQAKVRPRCFRLVYMAHPVAGDVKGNIERATILLSALKIKHEMTHQIIAPWIHEVTIFDDADPEQRRRGLDKCRDMIALCDELWLCGPEISGGMRQELEHARANEVQVLNMTEGAK